MTSIDIKKAGPVRRIARRLFDIRDGELMRCTWMFCFLLLLISAMMMVKPVSTALFLAEFSAQHLPFAYLLTAVLAAALSAGYARLLKKHPIETLMRATLWSAICLLMLFWVFIRFHWAREIFLYLFLVWTGLITLICASQFWLAAGLLFNVREAKRLFGLIGSGAIIGGIAGGYVTKFLAPVVGSLNLVFPAIGCLGLCLLIIERMWRTYAPSPHLPTEAGPTLPDPADGRSVLPRILRSPHLRLMAAILATGVIAARLVDYQFNAIVSSVITDKDQLASFLGFWMSNLNFLSLMIQILATRNIIQRLGVSASLFFLPSGILLGAAATLVYPVLWAAILIKLGDGCFKNSLNKSGLELLFLPVPRALKSQAKAFIDVFVDAAAGGLGGILLILMVHFLDMPPTRISLVLFGLVCCWFFLILRVRAAYIQAFSDKLRPDAGEAAEPVGPVPEDARLMGRISAVLDGTDDLQILRMLRMMSGYSSETFAPSLVRLLDHDSTEIRTAALAQLYFSRKTDASARVSELVRSEDFPLRTEAIRYLFHRSGNPVGFLDGFLKDPDDGTRGAALLCLVREAKKNRRLKAAIAPAPIIEAWLLGIDPAADKDRAVFIKKTCAEAIAAGDLPELYPYLHLLMQDTRPQVVVAAIRAAGETRDPDFVRMLLSFLGRRAVFRHAASAALACHGDGLLDLLEERLSNPYLAYSVRRHIPEVIASANSQKAVDLLARQLMQPDLGIRYEIIRAMNRLRVSSPGLVFDRSAIIPKIKKEAGDHMDLLNILYTQKQLDSDHGGPAARSREKLIRGLEVRLDASLERVFRLLGLSYPPVEMYNAYKGIRGTDAERRMMAVEFLDNVLDVDLKRIIMPVVETGTILDSGTGPARKNSLPDPGESYIDLLRGQDDFLKQKVLHLLCYQPDTRYIPHMAVLLGSPSRGVRTMARMALEKTGRFSLAPDRKQKRR